MILLGGNDLRAIEDRADIKRDALDYIPQALTFDASFFEALPDAADELLQQQSLKLLVVAVAFLVDNFHSASP